MSYLPIFSATAQHVSSASPTTQTSGYSNTMTSFHSSTANQNVHSPLHVHAVPMFDSNYCWLLETSKHASSSDSVINNEVIVIDPGEAKPVLAYLAQHQLTISAIWITHRHRDHVGGLDEILAQFPVPVYGPSSPGIPQVTQLLSEGSHFALSPDYDVEIWHTPGHLVEHICYIVRNVHTPATPSQLFCGDVLFGAGCGRNFEGHSSELKMSLERLANLPDDTLMYPAHEYTEANLAFAKELDTENPAIDKRLTDVHVLRAAAHPTLPTTVALEKQTNPFLRIHSDHIRRRLAQRCQGTLTHDHDYFAAMRHLKDVF